MLHVGNDVDEGQKCAAIVVAVHGDQPDSCVNLKVLLDGADDYWAPSVKSAFGPVISWDFAMTPDILCLTRRVMRGVCSMALDDDEKEIAELWRLLKAFERITDLKTRREVIEQVEELVSAKRDERGTEH